MGLIGGGKTYNATVRMLQYMASGGVVYSNITLLIDPWYNVRYASKMKEFKTDEPEGTEREVLGIKYIYDDSDLCLCRVDDKGQCWSNSEGVVNYLRRVYKWEYQAGQYNKLHNEAVTGELHSLVPRGTPDKPVLMVIDEAVDFFDTDDRGSANKEFLSFLRHSRKQCVDVIFIAQDFSELNKRIRNQTQYLYTFADLSKFIIAFGRTLPPPWRHMILMNQWTRHMTGKPLNREFISKDRGIFGCYRTDELFRNLKSADGKTDYGCEGKIEKDRQKMNVIEKVALYACLLVSIMGYFGGRKGAVKDVSSSVEVESVQSVGDSEGAFVANEERYFAGVRVRYGRFRTTEVRDKFELRSHYLVDGIEYKLGDQTPDGVVLAANAEQVHIMSAEGVSTFIYPHQGHLVPGYDEAVEGERLSDYVASHSRGGNGS